jgi:hypothetical protein
MWEAPVQRVDGRADGAVAREPCAHFALVAAAALLRVLLVGVVAADRQRVVPPARHLPDAPHIRISCRPRQSKRLAKLLSACHSKSQRLPMLICRLQSARLV